MMVRALMVSHLSFAHKSTGLVVCSFLPKVPDAISDKRLRKNPPELGGVSHLADRSVLEGPGRAASLTGPKRQLEWDSCSARDQAIPIRFDERRLPEWLRETSARLPHR